MCLMYVPLLKQTVCPVVCGAVAGVGVGGPAASWSSMEGMAEPLLGSYTGTCMSALCWLTAPPSLPVAGGEL